MAEKGQGNPAFFRESNTPAIGPITSVYFGGGTPSLMRPESAARVIEKIDRFFGLEAGAEISIEANPKTVYLKKLRAFRAAGINRISIGAQSLDDGRLRFLGRIHNADDALRTIGDARKAFDNINADFIYATPGQGFDDWAEELERIAALGPPHLSLYQLALERGTPMRRTARPIDDGLAARMFEHTNRRLRRVCPQYEISNYAKPGFECRHNVNYWNGGEYIGIGPAAAGRIRIGGRFFETKNPAAPFIMRRDATGLSVDSGPRGRSASSLGPGRNDWTGEPILRPMTRRARLREMLLSGLRMNRGIDFAEFEKNCGIGFWSAANRNKAEEFAELGLLSTTDKKIRLLKRGRIVLDHLVCEIAL
ncbi:MAG: radical SAM protein [Rickettsiales bacterium]|nr:radical SAM protein [Rickettsiales bacterium]